MVIHLGEARNLVRSVLVELVDRRQHLFEVVPHLLLARRQMLLLLIRHTKAQEAIKVRQPEVDRAVRATK